jgi:hypothetical protein
MVAGTARSGTTWLADIIGSQISCRLMFEPFHSDKVEEFSKFQYFQYMRPHEKNEALFQYCKKIFSGDIRNGWVDSKVERLWPQYRIIKEIRANLFLKWIHNMIPDVPILYIIRHPCAVVLSRMELGWATDTDIEPLLSQSKLVNDFLVDKIDTIKNAKTSEEKHAIIWCISNLVPIKQFSPGELNIIFYENLCLKPEVEVLRVFQAIQHKYQNSVLKVVGQPSTTTILRSAILTGDDKVALWKKKLSSDQIKNIISTVRDFDLDYLYGESVTPLVTSNSRKLKPGSQQNFNL